MRNSARAAVAILIVASILIIGSLNLIPFARADGLPPEKVPEPWVLEVHKYNLWGDKNGVPDHDLFINERWSIEVKHGDVMTLIMARNISQPSQNNISGVDYTNNIHYNINGTLYIAQFMITELTFNIANQTMDKAIQSPLSTCTGFKLEYSQIRYDGTVPTFDCNITYEDIRVYPSGHPDSTFDLTLIHHIRANWTQTDDKIEAKVNFNNTRFYQANGTEFDAGVPFTVELGYRMYMTQPGGPNNGFIAPTGMIGNDTLEYNLTLDNGSPLTLSELNMKDDFKIYNGSGAHDSMGYHMMMPGNPFSPAMHGFPNLTYRDTTSIKSDPEIIVHHDRVTEENNQNPWANGGLGASNLPQIAAVCAIIAVGAIGAVLFLKRKRKKVPEETGKKPKKT